MRTAVFAHGDTRPLLGLGTGTSAPGEVGAAVREASGISTIPKSVSRERLRENLAARQIELSAADLQRIAALDQHLRLVDGSFWLMEGDPLDAAGPLG